GIAAAESRDRVDRPITDKRTVLAFEILDRDFVAGDSDARGAPRDAWRIEEQLEIGVAAEDVLAVRQTGTAPGPHQTEGDDLSRNRGPVGARLGGRGPKRVAKPVDSTDEPRVRRLVAECRADL